METKLTRIAELAKRRPRVKLQTLIHAIDEESLKASHMVLAADKATGVDAVTKAEYGENLEENIDDLLGRRPMGTCLFCQLFQYYNRTLNQDIS